MIKPLSLTSLSSSTEKGFVLLEFCIAISLSLLLATILHRTTLLLLHSWQEFRQEQQQLQAQSYMFNQLEYELAQNGNQLTVSLDGQKLDCKSIYGYRSLSYTREYINRHYGLYVTTKNAKGYSKNPLFIPDCDLHAWKLEILSPNKLLIQLELTNGKKRHQYSRVLTLLNGRIDYEK